MLEVLLYQPIQPFFHSTLVFLKMVFYIVLNSNWLIGKSGTSKAAKALFSIKIDRLRMQPYPLS